jgi:putative protease
MEAKLDVKTMKRAIILSPVTSFSGAVKVIAAGADELYCAVKIPGAEHLLNRAELCCIPTYEELSRVASYAHSKGATTVVTLELPFISDFMAAQMRQHIASCVDSGIDALIVGDIGLIQLIKDMGLDTPVYASTLLAAMNYRAVDFIRELGVDRVILERQMTIEEVAETVRRHQDLEIEVFVHGGGCSNIDINCYLEPLRAPQRAIQRVAAQVHGMVTPCRWPYDIYDLEHGERKMDRAPILDAFSFCSLCRLPELMATGVSGIKIVGRCMPLPYQVKATEMYRELVDLLMRGSRRGFNRAQRRRFYATIEPWKQEPFQPEIQNPDGSWSALGSHQDVVCTQGRCYYSPLFHVPYGHEAPSPTSPTKP